MTSVGSSSQAAGPTLRYLAPFDTRRIPRLETGVLVIGSGVAGLRAAIEAAQHTTVILATKGALSESNSDWAQGGIAAAMGPPDSAARHAADTIAVGAGLCDHPVVDAITGAAKDAIDELVAWGARFDRDESGALAGTFEGGHSHPRVRHARGDSTGAEIVATLISTADRAGQLRILEHAYVIDLVSDGEGRCRGALLFTRHGEFQLVEADATVLATGGLGRMFRDSTNPSVATGDGVAMAYRAGAVVSDIELVQFHPTTLYLAGAPRALITEALRGEGAQLRNAAGERFMVGVHPDAELAPRDVVSRAILEEMRRSGEAYVHLDLRHLDHARVLARFPRIAALVRTFALDVATDMLPVRPSAHYAIGGVEADLDGRTSVPRLLAAGEAAATGFHGANRLGSNSLLEGLVTGRRAGATAATLAAGEPLGAGFEMRWTRADEGAAGRIDMDDLESSLLGTMWRQVGIVRAGERLLAARRQIEFWGRYVWQRTFLNPAGWSLQNMLSLGWLISHAALSREESRGVHWREDYPRAAAVAKHSRVAREAPDVRWRAVRERDPVATASGDVA